MSRQRVFVGTDAISEAMASGWRAVPGLMQVSRNCVYAVMELPEQLEPASDAFSVTPAMAKVLNDLAAKSGGVTRAELIRRAIGLLKVVVDGLAGGEAPVMLNQDGTVAAHIRVE